MLRNGSIGAIQPLVSSMQKIPSIWWVLEIGGEEFDGVSCGIIVIAALTVQPCGRIVCRGYGPTPALDEPDGRRK